MALQLPDQHGDQREQRLHESSSSLPDQRREPAQLCLNTFGKSTILREHVQRKAFALDQRQYWIFCILGHVGTLMSKCILLQEFTNGCIVFHRF